MDQRLRWRTHGMALLAVVVAAMLGSCSVDQLPTASSDRALETGNVAAAAYARALANPRSLGREHNRWLDTIIADIRAERARRGGRRLGRAAVCDVFAKLIVRAEANAATRQQIANGVDARRPICNLQERVVALAAAVPASLPPVATFDWMDDLDSIVVNENWSHDDDELPSPLADSVTVVTAAETINTSIGATWNLTATQTAVADAVDDMGQWADEYAAEFIGEIASVANESADYWYQEWDDWVAEVDPECDSLCYFEEGLRAGVVAFDGGGVHPVVAVVGADVVGFFGILSFFKNVYDVHVSWEQKGWIKMQQEPLFRGQVVLEAGQGASKKQLGKIAGRLVRASALQGGVVGAAVESAAAALF